MAPHEGVRFGFGSAPTSEPVPVGATVEQICRFSTLYKYVKVVGVPENEQERCIVSFTSTWALLFSSFNVEVTAEMIHKLKRA